MKRNIVITETAALLPDEQPVEIVERKGISLTGCAKRS